ncbi:hypothetical protein ACFE04_020373 [Oxalis oulophora]
MAFTTSVSLTTISAIPTTTKPATSTTTLFSFPILPLKTRRITIPTLACSRQTETTFFDTFNYDVDTYEYDVDEELENGGICAVPKKRLSRSKTKIRKNIWKRKARVAAMKAYSLAKSIATGNSKSFLVITKSSSSPSSPPSSTES